VETEQLTNSTELTTNSQVSVESQPGPYRMCRIGNLLWKLPESKDRPALKVMSPADKRQAIREVCSALEQDSRVVNVMVPDISPDFTVRSTFYPDLNRTSEDDLLNGADAFQVLELSDPIRFHMHVPKKNQPQWHGWDNIPTEDYFVAWDGISAFVLWEQDSDRIPLPGGQIVTDILSFALATTQAELYIQACSPDCDNIFFHTNLYLHPDEDYTYDGAPKIVRRKDENAVDVAIPADESNFEILEWLHSYLGSPASHFAKLKNLGRRVMDIESSIRDQMAHLLSHYYEHAAITAKPLWRSLKDRWRIRWWRREARQILAGLWLSLANVESLRREWQDSRRTFEGNDDEYMAIFEVDYSNDVAVIESLEVGHLNATIEQISRNLDNRALLFATVVGALAGALAGALVGLIH
jgi:hypothetical protein